MSSTVRSLRELTDIAFYDIVPSLHRIPGVYRVEMIGGEISRVRRTASIRRSCSPAISVPMTSSAASPRPTSSSPRDASTDSHRMLLTVVTANSQTRAGRGGSDRHCGRAAGDGARYRQRRTRHPRGLHPYRYRKRTGAAGRHLAPAQRQHGRDFQCDPSADERAPAALSRCAASRFPTIRRRW